MKTLSAVLFLSSCLVGCGGGGSSSPTSSSENTPTQVEPVIGTGIASQPVITPDEDTTNPVVPDTLKNSVPNENPKKDQVVVDTGSSFETPKEPVNNQPDPLKKIVTNPTPVVENKVTYAILETEATNFEQSTFDNVKFQ